MNCNIYFHHFDIKKINEGGWEGKEGKLYLKYIKPLKKKEKSIDSLDTIIEKNKLKYIGELNLKNPEDSMTILQNNEQPHKLNDRSMMNGDIVICENKDGPKIGKLAEFINWSDLNENQINLIEKKFKK